MGKSDDRPAKAFGKVICAIRAERGLSQEKLALLCELDRTYISMLERGKRQPSLKSILKLAACLDIPAQELVARTTAILNQ